MLDRVKNSMFKTRFALVDRDGLEKQRSPNVAEIKHEYVENLKFQQTAIEVWVLLQHHQLTSIKLSEPAATAIKQASHMPSTLQQ